MSMFPSVCIALQPPKSCVDKTRCAILELVFEQLLEICGLQYTDSEILAYRRTDCMNTHYNKTLWYLEVFKGKEYTWSSVPNSYSCSCLLVHASSRVAKRF